MPALSRTFDASPREHQKVVRETRPVRLASFFQMQPLWRVQVSSREVIRESSIGSHPAGTRGRLPYWFFQRVVGEQLELRSPGGYATFVSPHDICTVVPKPALIVHAMPRARFLQRSAMPLSARQQAPSDGWYAPAHVLYGRKDRFGHVQFVVSFIDPQLNGPENQPFAAPLRDDERARLEALARRTVMPIQGPGRANESADHGVSRAEDRSRRAVSELIAAALRGDDLRVGELMAVDA